MGSSRLFDVVGIFPLLDRGIVGSELGYLNRNRRAD
jgi:hypothetical protein